MPEDTQLLPDLDLEGLLDTVGAPEPLEVARLLGEDTLVGLVCGPQDPDGGPDFEVLETAGKDYNIRFEPLVWSDPRVSWPAYDALLPLQVGDYTIRASSFRHWLSERAKQGALLFNSQDILHWGMNKGYLIELQEMGVAMPLTELRLAGSRSPGSWPADSVLVLKPRVGSAGIGVELCPATHWRPPGQDLLVQEYDPRISELGEVSIVFVAGRACGQVRRKPGADDFRVSRLWGGDFQVEPMNENLVALAKQVLALLPRKPFYARVDLWDWQQPVLLSEVELVDPDLFLRCLPGAADHLSACLSSAISEHRG